MWRASGAVAIGLAILGLSAYAFLAFAGRALGPAAFAPVSVLWVVVNTIIIGLLAPIEQETGRLVAHHRSSGDPTGQVVRVAAAHALILVLVVGAVAITARDWLADTLFRGQHSFVDAAAAATAVYAVAYVSRGVLAGRGRFGRYGLQLGIEGAVRGIGAAVFLLAALSWVEGLAWLLVIAPAVAVVATWPPRERADQPQPTPAVAAFTRRLAVLMATAIVVGAMINSPPLLIELLDPGGAQTSTVLAALVVARLPLFVFAAVQAVAIPRLAGAVVHGRAAFVAGLRQILGFVVILAVAGVAVCGLLGPEIVLVAFGPEYVVDRSLTLLLAASGGAFIVAGLLSQAIVALGRHLLALAAWAVAAMVMVIVVLVIDDVVLRITIGSLAGSAAAAAALCAAMWFATRQIPVGGRSAALGVAAEVA